MIFTQILLSVLATVAAAAWLTATIERVFKPSCSFSKLCAIVAVLSTSALVGAAAWECSGLAIYWITPSVAGLGL